MLANRFPTIDSLPFTINQYEDDESKYKMWAHGRGDDKPRRMMEVSILLNERRRAQCAHMRGCSSSVVRIAAIKSVVLRVVAF